MDNNGYNPKPEDKPLTEGYQPTDTGEPTRLVPPSTPPRGYGTHYEAVERIKKLNREAIEGRDREMGKELESDLVSRLRKRVKQGGDAVNHPSHYNEKVPGIECIDVVQHFNFNQGNAIKYIWRCESKGKPIEDLEKAAWYIKQEIERMKKEGA